MSKKTKKSKVSVRKRVSYTFTYFLRKLKAIPAQKWIVHKINGDKGEHCALGFCREGRERSALENLFSDELGLSVPTVNDGTFSGFSKGQFPTLVSTDNPKDRVLEGFNLIRAKRLAAKHLKKQTA